MPLRSPDPVNKEFISTDAMNGEAFWLYIFIKNSESLPGKLEVLRGH